MRAFIAIDLPLELREGLTSALRELKALQVDARLSRPESIHLTLKFLGNIEGQQVEAIEGALEEVLHHQAPFSIRVGGLGVFPYLANPRVVWVGVEGGTALEDLQREVEGCLSPLGFPPEKRAFHPHLTLARVKSRRNIAALIHYVESSHSVDSLGEFTARALHLFQSTLRPEGAEYTKLVTLEFGSASGH